MTGWDDFAGIMVPIAIALLITWLPKITGDFIETQARDLAAQLKRGGFDEATRSEVQESTASFARGAALAAGAAASAVSYICGALGAITKTTHAPLWTWVTGIWGAMAFVYLLTTFTTHKLFQLDELYLRKPFSRTKAFTKVTHYQAVTYLLTVSSLIIAVIACDAKFLSPATPTSAVPGKAALCSGNSPATGLPAKC